MQEAIAWVLLAIVAAFVGTGLGHVFPLVH